MIKLHEKHQSPAMQEEAAKAVSLYYEMLQTTPHPPANPSGTGSDPLSMTKSEGNKAGDSSDTISPAVPLSIKAGTPKPGELSGKEWGKAYTDLIAEIKVRHYSPKTLRAYSVWVRKFQTFTKNKRPAELNPSDVKEFIRFLAVEKRVSASSQGIRVTSR